MDDAEREQQDRENPSGRLGELLSGIRFAMLTTVAPDGGLRSRPLTTQEVGTDGNLWFFISLDTDWVRELGEETPVNLAYADDGDARYVSVSGLARVVQDRPRAEKNWNKLYEAWFPGGLDDPNLALLRVDVQQADYWNSPHGKLSTLVGFVKAAVTGAPADDIAERGELRP